MLIFVDLLLSLLISYSFLEISNVPEDMLKSGDLDNMGLFPAIWNALSRVGVTYIYDVLEAGEPTWIFSSFDDRYPIAILFFLSTMFTSVWTVLVWISTIILRLTSRLQLASVWFLDVEKHPVQAIGIVSGALVMVGGLIWGGVRVFI